MEAYKIKDRTCNNCIHATVELVSYWHCKLGVVNARGEYLDTGLLTNPSPEEITCHQWSEQEQQS